MHIFDGVGSVFSSTRMSRNHGIPNIAKGDVKIMNPEFRKVQVAEQLQEMRISGVDRKTGCIHDLRLLQDQ